MEQTVDEAQPQLTSERVSESSGIAARGFGTDEDFAMLKCDHVGWSRFIYELAMQRRDFPVGDNQNRNPRQLAEVGLLLARQMKTKLRCFDCKTLKIDNVHRDFALKIAHRDFWSCRLNFALHRLLRIRSSCLRSA